MIENILHLPVEIGALIFTYLDTKSKIYAYSIIELRRFFAPCVMRKVNISRSTFAASKTLSLNALQDYAGNIHELNLSGIQDLTAEKLFPYLQKCTNLKTLDVTYTRIFLSDVEHICCDSLKNIRINYFERYWNEEVWKKCSDIFKKQMFESVHFVVSDLYYPESPLRFMEDIPMTKDLKITRPEKMATMWDSEESHDEEDQFRNDTERIGNIDIHFEHLCYIICDCPGFWGFKFDFNKIEYILIMYVQVTTIDIYVSPIFSPMFTTNININLQININICSDLYSVFHLATQGNIILKAWNKEVTVFDDEFFRNVNSELTDYFPIYICMHTMEPMRITEAPSHWYCIDSCDTFNELLDHLPEKVTLTGCCRQGSVLRWKYATVTLNPEIKSMKNITFLNIRNICTRDDFFTFLFLHCKKLYTLDVDVTNRNLPGSSASGSSTLSLLNSIHLTKSLKNLKLTLQDIIDYTTVFLSVCQCSSLENIHIVGGVWRRLLASYETDEQIIMSLIEKCCNLYSLYIVPIMSQDEVSMLKGTLRNAAQSMGRDYLCFEVCEEEERWHHPFDDVFYPSPLRITE